MVTRNVVSTASQSELVDRLVVSGRYRDASDALRAGLALLEREESEMSELCARLNKGLAPSSSGRVCRGFGGRGDPSRILACGHVSKTC